MTDEQLLWSSGFIGDTKKGLVSFNNSAGFKPGKNTDIPPFRASDRDMAAFTLVNEDEKTHPQKLFTYLQAKAFLVPENVFRTGASSFLLLVQSEKTERYGRIEFP